MAKKNFRDDLVERLKHPREAKGYLEAALADGNPDLFLEALKDVAEAQGGVGQIAKSARLHRTGLYRMLSSHGNPTYKTLRAVMEALGFRFKIEKAAA